MGVLRSANGTAAFFNPCQILVYAREVKSCVTLSICEVTGNTLRLYLVYHKLFCRLSTPVPLSSSSWYLLHPNN